MAIIGVELDVNERVAVILLEEDVQAVERTEVGVAVQVGIVCEGDC